VVDHGARTRDATGVEHVAAGLAVGWHRLVDGSLDLQLAGIAASGVAWMSAARSQPVIWIPTRSARGQAGAVERLDDRTLDGRRTRRSTSTIGPARRDRRDSIWPLEEADRAVVDGVWTTASKSGRDRRNSWISP
jgi:hypothetical protein